MIKRQIFYHLMDNFHFMQFLKQGCLEKRGRSHRGYYSRMKRYIYDFWNVVDLLSYLLLIVALFIRHFHPSETFTLARRMYALSLLVMYLRFLEVFLIHRKLGPTLIMIKEMVFVTSLHFAALNFIVHISNANIMEIYTECEYRKMKVRNVAFHILYAKFIAFSYFFSNLLYMLHAVASEAN